MKWFLFLLMVTTSVSADAAEKKRFKPTPKPIAVKTIDLKVDDNVLKQQTEEHVKSPELESKYEAKPKKSGDISLKPEIKYLDDVDPTKSDKLEKEKQFKLNFNLFL